MPRVLRVAFSKSLLWLVIARNNSKRKLRKKPLALCKNKTS